MVISRCFYSLAVIATISLLVVGNARAGPIQTHFYNEIVSIEVLTIDDIAGAADYSALQPDDSVLDSTGSAAGNKIAINAQNIGYAVAMRAWEVALSSDRSAAVGNRLAAVLSLNRT